MSQHISRFRSLRAKRGRRGSLTTRWLGGWLLCGLLSGSLAPGALGAALTAEEPSGDSKSPPPKILRVHWLGADAAASLESFQEWWIVRRLLQASPGWQIAAAVGLEGLGRGEAAASVVVAPLPLPEALQRRIAGLPIELPGGPPADRLVFDGTAYRASGIAAAFRLPARSPSETQGEARGEIEDETRGSDWVVTGGHENLMRSLLPRVLAAVLEPEGLRFGDSGEAEDADYLVSGGALRQSGVWRRAEVEGGNRYEVDPAHDRDDFDERRRWYSGLDRIARSRVVLRVPAGEARARRWTELADELDRAVARMAPRVPVTLDRPLQVAVETASPESHVRLGRYTGDLKYAVVTSPDDEVDLSLAAADRAEVHATVRPPGASEPSEGFVLVQALGRALIRRASEHRRAAAGEDAREVADLPPWVERGAALWLSESWYGRPYREWIPRLARAQVFPTAEELTAPGLGRAVVETLFTPVAAAALDRLPGETLEDKLQRATREDSPSKTLTATLGGSLEGALARALESLEVSARKVALPRRSVPARAGSREAREARVGDDFLAGVSFAMAPGLTTGYHAPRSMEQLTRVRERLGADAVSLMPFASMRDPAQPAMGFLNQGTGSETDLGLVEGARAARDRGLTVLWKPHVYVGGSWPGEIAMTSEQDWQAWWRLYRRYIVHHAFLAAHAEADLFSVGVELGKTLDREADWRHLIHSVRLFFDGPLTYSGNWWGDADRAPFWDALDYLGVDAYYPLGESRDMTDRQLAAGAREAVAELRKLTERHGKPILLTEVGFAARKGAWVSPHEEGGEPDVTHQARAYDALFSALGRPPWLAGVFVWKVFSAGSEGPPAPRPDFVFLGRPAEAHVQLYFEEREDPRPSTR